jgi:hypothetical protein
VGAENARTALSLVGYEEELEVQNLHRKMSFYLKVGSSYINFTLMYYNEARLILTCEPLAVFTGCNVICFWRHTCVHRYEHS